MLDFYRRIESTPVDIVYLGETVCSKRRSLHHRDWIDIAERLAAEGKEIVLSTLALLEADSELGYVRKLCNNGSFAVEANDMSAVQLLAGKASFVGGPSLNIYNPRALHKLVSLGMTRWVMPVELSRNVLAELKNEIPSGIESEIIAWGRLPLAYSARCYTARAHQVSKDACAYCCSAYPDGLMISTREDEEFLTINGIQTQSARVQNLVGEMDECDSSVDILRISPQSEGTEQVISLFDQVRTSASPAGAVSNELKFYAKSGFCNGYWHGRAGMDFFDATSRQ
jgi:collagenase-like PrtC family protease